MRREKKFTRIKDGVTVYSGFEFANPVWALSRKNFGRGCTLVSYLTPPGFYFLGANVSLVRAEL